MRKEAIKVRAEINKMDSRKKNNRMKNMSF